MSSGKAALTERRGALVTGAAGGIGRALCTSLRAAGYFVIATDRAVERLQADVDCDRFLPCDVALVARDDAAQAKLAADVADMLGGIPLGVIVNNAAVQILGRFEVITASDFQASLDVNLIAPLRVTQALLPLLVVGGCIINIGSVHAQATKPGFVSYATTKAAIGGLTRALAVDLGPRARVLCIAPAATSTPMLMAGFADAPEAFAELEAAHPLARIATPAEVANFTVALCGVSQFVSGATFLVDGGILSRLHDPL